MISDKLAVASGSAVIVGRGLVASRTVASGEVVWQPDPEYPLVDRNTLRVLRETGNRDYYSQVDKGLYARNSSDAWRFNHSCQPNCTLKGRRTLALRQIPTGEELSYDYGLTEVGMWYRFWCQCGSPGCRRLVTGLDYLDGRILENGRPWAADYVLEAAALATRRDQYRFALLRRLLLLRQRYLSHCRIPASLRRRVFALRPPVS